MARDSSAAYESAEAAADRLSPETLSPPRPSFLHSQAREMSRTPAHFRDQTKMFGIAFFSVDVEVKRSDSRFMTTTTNTADTHNDDMNLLGLLEPTFRALLVELAFDDTLDWRATSASNYDLFSAEMDALRDLCDLSHSQFNIVAAAAYRLAAEA